MEVLSTQQFIIRVTDKTLAFALREGGDKVIDFELYDTNLGMSVATNLREAFQKSRLLHVAGRDVVVTIDAPMLFIPVDDYDESQMMEQYRYVYPDTENVLLRSLMLPSLKTMVVFALEKDLGVVLSDHFNKVSVEPIMSRLWDVFLHRDGDLLTKKMYVYFHENKVEICSFYRRRLVFANSFKVESIEDSVYFMLGAWQQINAKGDKDNLVLCGKVDNRDTITKELQRYIQDVSYLDPAAEVDKSRFSKLEDMPLDMIVWFV